MWTQEVGKTSQLWVKYETDQGDKYFNAQTMLPLFMLPTVDTFIYETDTKTILNANDPNQALDRGWGQNDGVGIQFWNKHGAPNQKFTFEYVATTTTTTTTTTTESPTEWSTESPLDDGCPGKVEAWWGDQYCDDFMNTEGCGYDDGDCCQDHPATGWDNYCQECDCHK